MPFTYYLLLTTFLAWPLIAFILSQNFSFNKLLHHAKRLALFFLIHNILFAAGYSLKGDLPDYIIFSVEYLFLCLIIFSSFKSKNYFIKVIRIITAILICCGLVVGVFGIVFFIFITMDTDANRFFHFSSNDKTYETRLYNFGGATLSDTRFTFDTYRTFKYLPIEHKLDETIFFDDKTNLDLSDPFLKIKIIETGNSVQISFASANGNTFLKKLK